MKQKHNKTVATKVAKGNNKKVATKVGKGLRDFNPATENLISAFNGCSLKGLATAWVAAGYKMPIIYKFCASTPVRADGINRVLVEGRFSIGCIFHGQKTTLARVMAGLGYKLPCSGTPERCDELIKKYKDAIKKAGARPNK